MARIRPDWPATKRATTVTADDAGRIVVTYHRTRVFTWNPTAQHVQLDSGGHMTYTTKARINEAFEHFGLPYQVYQKNFEWFVEKYKVNGEVLAKGRPTWPFVDGMIVGVS